MELLGGLADLLCIWLEKPLKVNKTDHNVIVHVKTSEEKGVKAIAP